MCASISLVGATMQQSVCSCHASGTMSLSCFESPILQRTRTEVIIVYKPTQDNRHSYCNSKRYSHPKANSAIKAMIVDGSKDDASTFLSSPSATSFYTATRNHYRTYSGGKSRLSSASLPRSWYVPQTASTRFYQDNARNVQPPSTGNNSTAKHLSHTNKTYCNETFSQMAQMRQEGILCDVKLKIEDKIMPVHKVVLAACSPYFKAMFTSEMVEKSQNSITMHGITAKAASLLIDYAYSGKLIITEENVQVLLPAASHLQIDDIQIACSNFLISQLHPSNCLGIKRFADTHSCTALHDAAHSYSLKNFEAVSEHEEFLNLSGNEVIHLITNENLVISCEDEVYKAVISWLKHGENREAYLIRLMKCIRFPLMSKNSLIEIVQSEPIIRLNNECKDLLIEAMAYHLSPDKRGSSNNIRTKERILKNSKQFLFVLGGSSVFSIQNDCECYDPRLERWATIPSMTNKRTRMGVTSSGQRLYVIGGYDGVKDLSSGEIYDPVKNCWSQLTPMGTRRSCLGVCSLNGLVYATGGYDGSVCLESAERYDPLAESWTSIQYMNTKRRYHKLISLGGCLYAIGGFDGTNYLCSVEKYNPQIGKWETMASMSHKRSGAGATVYDGKIYVCGGTDGAVSLSTGEYYNPTKNRWKCIATMMSRRATHELVEIDNCLYAVGGNDGSISLNTIEKYDPKGNTWKMETSMISRRNSVGAAAFRCNSNIESLFNTKQRKVHSDI